MNIVYQYKNIKSHSKYEIMRLASNVDDVTWDYNDDFYNTFDWTKEPEETLNELYYRKAKSLREKYDYLVLMYSGGSDSSNILDIFCRYNVHLDEICSHINYEGSNQIDNLLNGEILKPGGAKERAEQYITEYNLKTKFRLYDVTKKTIEIYNKVDFDLNYYMNNAGVSFTMAKPKAGTIMQTGVKEWMDLYSSGKKIAFIWGNHKPMVIGCRGEFFFKIHDYLDQSVSVKGIVNKQNDAIDELFYWGDDENSVRIMIKQGHVIKKFLSDPINRFRLNLKYSNKKIDEEFIHQNELSSGYTDYNEATSCRMGNDEIRELIYPYWKPDHEKLNKKQISNFLNEKDEWFWKKSDASVDVYLKQLQNFTETINDCWKNSFTQHNGIGYVKKIKTLDKLYRI